MTFVKWGIDYTNPNWAGTAQGGPALRQEQTGQFSFSQQQIGPKITTEVCIDGVPVKKYQDMANDRKDLIRVLKRLLDCAVVDPEVSGVIGEAHQLLARMGESND